MKKSPIDAKTCQVLEDLAFDWTIGCGNTEEEDPPQRLVARLSHPNYLGRPLSDQELEHFVREWHWCIQEAAQP